MSTIVTRIGKGTPLTWIEGDANFTNLNTDKAELTNLANTADVAKGDALIGARRTETGADATTLHAINQARPLYVPADFTGGTFTQALQDALASGALNVQLTGSGTITSICTLAAGQILDLGGYQLGKGFNGDMLDMSAGACKLRNGSMFGDGATFTGRGIIIGGNTDQKITAVQSTNMDGYNLEFTAINAGSRFRMDAGGLVWQRQVATNAAIKLPAGESLTDGTRYFSNIFTGGGVMVDPSGGNMSFFDMCNCAGLVLTSTSNFFHSSNTRWAGTITVDGSGHHIEGCSIGNSITVNGSCTSAHLVNNNVAGSLTLNSGASGIRADDTNNFQSGVTDNSANVTNHLYTEADFTPTWTGDGTPPALGNGTITGRYTRRGKHIRISIQLTMGSTTTYGTGAWAFTMPTALQFNVRRQALGIVRIADTGTAWYIGLPRTGSGAAPRIYTTINAAGGDVSATVPHTWANTDILELEVEWEIG